MCASASWQVSLRVLTASWLVAAEIELLKVDAERDATGIQSSFEASLAMENERFAARVRRVSAVRS
jgi:hypothetical protein